MWHRDHVTSMVFPTTIYCLWLISSKLACCLMTPIVAKGISMMDKNPLELPQRKQYLSRRITGAVVILFLFMTKVESWGPKSVIQVKGNEPSNDKMTKAELTIRYARLYKPKVSTEIGNTLWNSC
ncbi:hypothetical protein BDV34DRAFT_132769 [Aspergillus parasiticus]|uniref:Uncharacterized protein n=1 Tax=Aspergillus parasiticus TaxID=5067 RepID=A0A5N6DDY9_ASPPA|nr:hypothetical protein BDV34DRAFT_132769 [Aspergillus parasiticus]